jgi:hypothetical protein
VCTTTIQYYILLLPGVPFVWDTTLHHWVIGSRRFEATFCLILLEPFDHWMWGLVLNFFVPTGFCKLELKHRNTNKCNSFQNNRVYDWNINKYRIKLHTFLCYVCHILNIMEGYLIALSDSVTANWNFKAKCLFWGYVPPALTFKKP